MAAGCTPAVARPDDSAGRRRRAGGGSSAAVRSGTSNGGSRGTSSHVATSDADSTPDSRSHGPAREPATESVYSPEHFSFLTHDRVAVQGPDTRQVQDHRASRQRWIRYRLSRAGHLDRQEGRDQGAAPSGARLRRAAARAAAARQRQPSQHRVDHHGGEAGQPVLHRHGVRAGGDAREPDRRRRARSTSTARSTSPARSATPSIMPTARASSIATCARPTCW